MKESPDQKKETFPDNNKRDISAEALLLLDHWNSHPCFTAHKDPSKKEFTIGTKNIGFKRLSEEIKKCILLCANCHRELHSND